MFHACRRPEIKYPYALWGTRRALKSHLKHRPHLFIGWLHIFRRKVDLREPLDDLYHALPPLVNANGDDLPTTHEKLFLETTVLHYWRSQRLHNIAHVVHSAVATGIIVFLVSVGLMVFDTPVVGG